jgi:hypothetical protein
MDMTSIPKPSQEADVAHRSAAVAEAGDRVVVVEVVVVVKAGARWVLRVLRRVRRRVALRE